MIAKFECQIAKYMLASFLKAVAFPNSVLTYQALPGDAKCDPFDISGTRSEVGDQ